MNLNKSVLFGVILAGLATISLSASAGGYASLSIGESSIEQSFEGENFDLGDSNTLFLTAGYKFNDNFAIEAGYHNFSEVNYQDDWHLGADGVSVALVASAAVGDSVDMHFALGNMYWTAVDQDRADFETFSFKGSDLFYRLGASFSATETISLTVDYSILEFSSYAGDLDGDTLSVGMRIDF